mgnify:CR=1 FL=1
MSGSCYSNPPNFAFAAGYPLVTSNWANISIEVVVNNAGRVYFAVVEAFAPAVSARNVMAQLDGSERALA